MGSFCMGFWRSCGSVMGSGRPLPPGSFEPVRHTDPSPRCAGKAARAAVGRVLLEPGASFLSAPRGSSPRRWPGWSPFGESPARQDLDRPLHVASCQGAVLHRAGVCWRDGRKEMGWRGRGRGLRWGWSWGEAEQLSEGEGVGVFSGAPRGCCSQMAPAEGNAALSCLLPWELKRGLGVTMGLRFLSLSF